mmetsp:Transcript_21953/g.62317  ORF Transcript_21953/g.62317 Transcript_21953/m.62317 type:complete len:276 (+) Transcript_21953:614-1441(+)
MAPAEPRQRVVLDIAVRRHEPKVALGKTLACDELRHAARAAKGLGQRAGALLAHEVSRLEVLGEHLDVVDGEPVAVFGPGDRVHLRLHVHGSPQQRARVDVLQLPLPPGGAIGARLEETEDTDQHGGVLGQVGDADGGVAELGGDGQQQRLPRRRRHDVVGHAGRRPTRRGRHGAAAGGRGEVDDVEVRGRSGAGHAPPHRQLLDFDPADDRVPLLRDGRGACGSCAISGILGGDLCRGHGLRGGGGRRKPSRSCDARRCASAQCHSKTLKPKSA